MLVCACAYVHTHVSVFVLMCEGAGRVCTGSVLGVPPGDE